MLTRVVRRGIGAVSGSPRWLLARGVAGTDPRLASLVVALAGIDSLLPIAFSLATGLLIGSLDALPQTVVSGGAAPAERGVVAGVALLGALFVLQRVVGPLGQVAADALGRRYMASVYRRVMRAALRPATVLHLETPELQDQIKQSLNEGWAGPRAATNGLVGWTSRRLTGVAALAVVAHFDWRLALLLAGALLWHLRHAQKVHSVLIAIRFLRTEPMRHADDLAEALTAGLTTVLISHRFSTVRRADRIAVLDAGGVTRGCMRDDRPRGPCWGHFLRGHHPLGAATRGPRRGTLHAGASRPRGDPASPATVGARPERPRATASVGQRHRHWAEAHAGVDPAAPRPPGGPRPAGRTRA